MHTSTASTLTSDAKEASSPEPPVKNTNEAMATAEVPGKRKRKSPTDGAQKSSKRPRVSSSSSSSTIDVKLEIDSSGELAESSPVTSDTTTPRRSTFEVVAKGKSIILRIRLRKPEHSLPQCSPYADEWTRTNPYLHLFPPHIWTLPIAEKHAAIVTALEDNQIWTNLPSSPCLAAEGSNSPALVDALNSIINPEHLPSEKVHTLTAAKYLKQVTYFAYAQDMATVLSVSPGAKYAGTGRLSGYTSELDGNNQITAVKAKTKTTSTNTASTSVYGFLFTVPSSDLTALELALFGQIGACRPLLVQPTRINRPGCPPAAPEYREGEFGRVWDMKQMSDNHEWQAESAWGVPAYVCTRELPPTGKKEQPKGRAGRAKPKSKSEAKSKSKSPSETEVGSTTTLSPSPPAASPAQLDFEHARALYDAFEIALAEGIPRPYLQARLRQFCSPEVLDRLVEAEVEEDEEDEEAQEDLE